MNSEQRRPTCRHLLALLMALTLAALPLTVAAQLVRTSTSVAVPRPADGRPDLQGMWTNATLTPLEDILRGARFLEKSK